MPFDDIDAFIQMVTTTAPNLLPDTRTRLSVTNLPYHIRWQDLKDLFHTAGTVLRADVSVNSGCGTVLLATMDRARRAVSMFSGYLWHGHFLEVHFTDTRGNDYVPPGSNLFVENLPFHIQWQDLKDTFRKAGPILYADVALDHNGRSRGFGTIIFAKEEDACRAVDMFSGYEYNGRSLKVYRNNPRLLTGTGGHGASDRTRFSWECFDNKFGCSGVGHPASAARSSFASLSLPGVGSSLGTGGGGVQLGGTCSEARPIHSPSSTVCWPSPMGNIDGPRACMNPCWVRPLHPSYEGHPRDSSDLCLHGEHPSLILQQHVEYSLDVQGRAKVLGGSDAADLHQTSQMGDINTAAQPLQKSSQTTTAKVESNDNGNLNRDHRERKRGRATLGERRHSADPPLRKQLAGRRGRSNESRRSELRVSSLWNM